MNLLDRLLEVGRLLSVVYIEPDLVEPASPEGP